jgi:nicotinate-nucleotide adenylyltransferase
MDTVAELPTWREIARLARLCRFVPLSRPGHGRPNAAALERAVGRLRARALLQRALAMPPIGISSSEIRRRVADGRTIRYLVPDAVAAYIRRKRLYATSAEGRRGDAETAR